MGFFERIMGKKEKKKLLLHVCCGPCATHCVSELSPAYSVSMYFFNPNIHPYGEFDRRYASAAKVAESFGTEMIDGEYSPRDWLDTVQGMEEDEESGRRCKTCVAMRLERTAAEARKRGFDSFTTTLSVSSHKDSKLINDIGNALAKKYSVEWVHSDFKKKDGIRKMVELSTKMKLYRQRYCGCFYSEVQGVCSGSGDYWGDKSIESSKE
jgi:hypothetical protein